VLTLLQPFHHKQSEKYALSFGWNRRQQVLSVGISAASFILCLGNADVSQNVVHHTTSDKMTNSAAETTLGVLSFVSNFLSLLSPLPDTYRVHRQKHTGEMVVLPLVTMWMNNYFWYARISHGRGTDV
jgi:hypothetical protein